MKSFVAVLSLWYEHLCLKMCLNDSEKHCFAYRYHFYSACWRLFLLHVLALSSTCVHMYALYGYKCDKNFYPLPGSSLMPWNNTWRLGAAFWFSWGMAGRHPSIPTSTFSWNNMASWLTTVTMASHVTTVTVVYTHFLLQCPHMPHSERISSCFVPNLH